MTDRVPGAPGQYSAVIGKDGLQKLQKGEPFAITLTRDDRPIKEGTPYSKAAVLPDAVAQVLCPEVEDPAPKDAFAALQEKKADAVQHRTGSVIKVNNSAHTPIKGFRVFGKTTQNGTPTPDAPVALKSVGDTGTIQVRVAGKNLCPTAEMVNENGEIYLSSKFFAPGTYTLSALITKYADDTATNTYISVWIEYADGTSGSFSEITAGNAERDGVARLKTVVFTVEPKSVLRMRVFPLNYFSFDSGKPRKNSRKAENIQVECGNIATDYEVYITPQILTVSTPNGFHGIASVQDEIDLAKGVYIQRIGVIESYANEEITGAYMSTTGELTEGAKVIYVLDEPIEMALTEEELTAYAALHTYSPNTTITNDRGAEMEIVHYTPTTAVQMVHSPKDVGKFLSVDQHGCVVLITPQVDAENVRHLPEVIQEEVSLWHENVPHVQHTETYNGWHSRLWSDSFAVLYATGLQGATVNEDGYCEVSYPLPHPMSADSSVQVTALGKAFLTAYDFPYSNQLRLVFEGDAGSKVFNVNLTIAGYVSE